MTNDKMILYYCLMTKVDWFRQYYGIFLGGLSHEVVNPRGKHHYDNHLIDRLTSEES
jgi:hypothetical protein